MAEENEASYTGPDPNPRPAKFRPPKNSCDSHSHLYGPVAKFPYPDGITPPPDAGFEGYMRMHEVLGIDRGVLTQSSQYKTDNRAVLDALERGAPNLRAIVALHPEDITDKVLADLDAKGARGIRMHHEELRDLE